MKQGYKTLFTQKLYLRNISANLINRFGDAIDSITFTWLMYSITNSPAWSAIILGINVLPNIIIQPFAGAIVERLSKKKVIVICDVARGVLTMGILMLYMMNQLSPWILLVVTFLNNSFESFRNPASTSFVPMILAKEHYAFGLSFNQSSSRIVELIGTGLAGVVIAALGMQGAFIIDMMTFFLCALIIYSIPVKEQLEKHSTVIKERIKQCLVDMKEGFHYIVNAKVLLLITCVSCILNTALVPLNSFQAPYISGVLHAPVYVLSAMSMSISIGITLGSFLYPYFHSYINNRMLLLGGGVVMGIYYSSLVMIAQFTNLTVITISIIIVNFLLAIAIGGMIAMNGVVFMKSVNPAYIARASAMQGAIATLGMPIMSFFLSALTDTLGILNIFLLFSVFTIVIFVGMMFVKTLKEI